MKGGDGSHWEGCWRDHHDCAVKIVERLLQEKHKLQGECGHLQAGLAECKEAVEIVRMLDELRGPHDAMIILFRENCITVNNERCDTNPNPAYCGLWRNIAFGGNTLHDALLKALRAKASAQQPTHA